MKLTDSPTRYFFFTGKGGVGKTSVACAAAVALADEGSRVLLVSTDPASNLDQVLGVSLSSKPTLVPNVPRLFALNIDPEAAAAAYRERVIGPYRGVLPASEISGMEEQLSGACTVEVAAFDEFTAFVGNDGDAAGFDHIIFDTAPSGHTMRLLGLPAAWAEFIAANVRGASCLGPSTGLSMQQERYAAVVEALGDERRTTLVLVTRPESGAMREAARMSEELEALGLANQHLVINGLFHASDRGDEVAAGLEERGLNALEALPERLRSLPNTDILLRGHNIVGIDSLRELLGEMSASANVSDLGKNASIPDLPLLSGLVDEIAAKKSGLIMLMGKGGVGKTTVAVTITKELLDRGIPVHLTTSDPATDLSAYFTGSVEGLRLSRIDPVAETEAYRQKIISAKGKELDADGLALLEEDLRSPCTEEVAVFHAFSRAVAGARREVVVMDTAPTGHTLLLLDAAGSYHREVTRNQGDGINLVTPLMRLRDPEYTKVLIVTLAEATPVREASALQDDLRRAGIEPYAWIINSSVAAARPCDPLLVARAMAELTEIETITAKLAKRVAVVPLQIEKEERRSQRPISQPAASVA